MEYTVVILITTPPHSGRVITPYTYLTDFWSYQVGHLTIIDGVHSHQTPSTSCCRHQETRPFGCRILRQGTSCDRLGQLYCILTRWLAIVSGSDDETIRLWDADLLRLSLEDKDPDNSYRHQMARTSCQYQKLIRRQNHPAAECRCRGVFSKRLSVSFEI